MRLTTTEAMVAVTPDDDGELNDLHGFDVPRRLQASSSGSRWCRPGTGGPKTR